MLYQVGLIKRSTFEPGVGQSNIVLALDLQTFTKLYTVPSVRKDGPICGDRHSHEVIPGNFKLRQYKTFIKK